MERREALFALLNRTQPLPTILDILSKYPWDSEELVRISTKHLAAALEAYLNGTETSKFIEDWANAIEGRDDVGVDPHCADQILGDLHRLANPVPEGCLTREWARERLRAYSGLGRYHPREAS